MSPMTATLHSSPACRAAGRCRQTSASLRPFQAQRVPLLRKRCAHGHFAFRELKKNGLGSWFYAMAPSHLHVASGFWGAWKAPSCMVSYPNETALKKLVMALYSTHVLRAGLLHLAAWSCPTLWGMLPSTCQRPPPASSSPPAGTTSHGMEAGPLSQVETLSPCMHCACAG